MSNLTIVLLVFFASIGLLAYKRIRPDLIAILALLTLAVTGVVTTEEAWSGFGNPAVSTIWIMFVIAAGLQHTGVAGLICDYLLSIRVLGERGYLILIILISAGISAFMNNAPCAALLLPIYLELARRKGLSPGRILMPMSFAILIGGTSTVIGTPANLIASDILEARGLASIQMLDLLPFGICLLLLASVFMVPYFLKKPIHPEERESGGLRTARDLLRQYNLAQNSRWYKIPKGSALHGQSIEQSLLRRASELNLLLLKRDEQVTIVPQPEDILAEGDLLLLYGDFSNLEFISGWKRIEIEELNERSPLSSHLPIVMKALIFPGSELASKAISQTGLSSSYNTRIVSIIRDGNAVKNFSVSTKLEARDELILILSPNRVQYLIESGLLSDFTQINWSEIGRTFESGDRLYLVKLLENSNHSERKLNVVSLKAAFDISVLAIQREEQTLIDIKAATELEAGDQVLILANHESLMAMRGLQSLEFQPELEPISTIESALGSRFELVEFTISPRSNLAGQTLKDLNFSETFAATVLAIWRNGITAHRSFAHYRLQFGDALLLIARTSDTKKLRANTDLVPLSQFSTYLDHRGSSMRAIVIVALMLICMFTEVLDIPTSALLAAASMIVFRCLTMEQAYHSIDWKSVVLMAGFWPLGIAMSNSGADEIFADWLLSHSADFGPLGVVAVLYVATNLLTTVIPHSTLVMLIAPIAIKCAAVLDISPHACVYAVAIAASACFWSPIAHPVNLMIMSPGRYTFRDFLKAGVPITLIAAISTLTLIQLFYL